MSNKIDFFAVKEFDDDDDDFYYPRFFSQYEEPSDFEKYLLSFSNFIRITHVIVAAFMTVVVALTVWLLSLVAQAAVTFLRRAG